MNDKTYNGWTNRETWNIALWIGNDEGLYLMAVDFMECYEGVSPYRSFVASSIPDNMTTRDGVSFRASNLDNDELDQMMEDLVTD